LICSWFNSGGGGKEMLMWFFDINSRSRGESEASAGDVVYAYSSSSVVCIVDIQNLSRFSFVLEDETIFSKCFSFLFKAAIKISIALATTVLPDFSCVILRISSNEGTQQLSFTISSLIMILIIFAL